MVLKDIDVSAVTTEKLMEMIQHEIATNPAYSLHKTKKYDALKIHVNAFGHKTDNLVINLHDDDTLFLQNGVLLAAAGVQHETEISCFNLEEYKTYKQNPIVKW